MTKLCSLNLHWYFYLVGHRYGKQNLRFSWAVFRTTFIKDDIDQCSLIFIPFLSPSFPAVRSLFSFRLHCLILHLMMPICHSTIPDCPSTWSRIPTVCRWSRWEALTLNPRPRPSERTPCRPASEYRNFNTGTSLKEL